MNLQMARRSGGDQDLTRSINMAVRAFTPNNPPKGESVDFRLNPTFGGRFVKPRFIPGHWVRYTEINTRLKACVEEICTASVGLDVYGVPDPRELDLLKDFKGRGKDPGKNRRLALEAAAGTLTRFCERPKAGSFLPLSWELRCAESDYQSSGNAYLEMYEEGRVAGGKVLSICHVPCPFVRVDRDRTTFVQGQMADTYGGNSQQSTVVFSGRYYRVFGDTDPSRRFIDKITGDFYAEWPSRLPESRRGTAILHAKNYCPLDPYYGMPPYTGSLPGILSNEMMSRFMLAYLENGTQVPILIIVEGANLTPGSAEKIEAMFNSDARGLSNVGRAAVIEPTIHGVVGTGAKIRVEQVELGVMKALSGLLELKSANDGAVLESFRMSGVFIGGGEGSQTTVRNASILKHLSFEHVIEPRAVFWERLLSECAAPSIALGAVFRARRPRNLDPLQVASILAKMKDALNVPDARTALNGLIPGLDLPVLELSVEDKMPFSLVSEHTKIAIAEINAEAKAHVPTTVPTNTTPLHAVPA